MVLEPGNLVWTGVGYGAHGVMLALQLFLALFLLLSGLAALLQPGLESKWLRRLGAARLGAPDSRGYEVQRIVLGVVLLLPALLRAPWQVSFLAAVTALALLTATEFAVPKPGSMGRLLRLAAIAASAFTATFMLWERDDAIALGAGVLTKMEEWRTHELDWQLTNDPRSPKVGDLAPDFALADPTGTKTARLSDFRGKRPVALVFGSYT
jgi:hypothetical protein